MGLSPQEVLGRDPKNSTLIVGLGEIGMALMGMFVGHKLGVHDPLKGLLATEKFYFVMHITFPYSDTFEDDVKEYKAKFKPKYTVIHSTVPVGTCRKLGAIHSPVIGIHPDLFQSLHVFTKYLAGERASDVADYFRRAGFKVYLLDKPEATELGKLAQTTAYALMVEFIKDLKRQCDIHNLSFTEVYTHFTENYNEGYARMNYPEFCLPQLTPIMKKQGGHCTIPNCDLWETKFTEFIKKMNEV